MVTPPLQTIGVPHFFWISTALERVPNVARTVSTNRVAPRTAFRGRGSGTASAWQARVRLIRMPGPFASRRHLACSHPDRASAGSRCCALSTAVGVGDWVHIKTVVQRRDGPAERGGSLLTQVNDLGLKWR